ncbi:MAG: 50S ribosomal protein L18 [Deltaproteobacteria bacterium]|nr:50S ribosomal protein L18 [Deltaproteobacteria bacterium]
MKTSKKIAAHLKRKKRIRKKINGTAERPRLSVFRSARHIYAQIIDDTAGVTLAAASTMSPEIRTAQKEGGKTGVAKMVGKVLAQRAQDRGIIKVAMDTNGFRYHGRLKALSEGAREQGLVF